MKSPYQPFPIKLLLVLSIFCAISKYSLGQPFSDTARTETLPLKDLHFKKVLAYQMNAALILVDYNEFMNAFMPMRDKLVKDVKRLRKQEKRGEVINRHYFAIERLVDSAYRLLQVQEQSGDTIRIDNLLFRSVDWNCGYDFLQSIHKGNCMILNAAGVRQSYVLIQYYSHQRGFLDGWGGWLYFIPGEKFPFLSKTKWMS
jgi:hypothetical protein